MDGLETSLLIILAWATLLTGYVLHGLVDYLKRKTKA